MNNRCLHSSTTETVATSIFDHRYKTVATATNDVVVTTSVGVGNACVMHWKPTPFESPRFQTKHVRYNVEFCPDRGDQNYTIRLLSYNNDVI